MKNRLKVGLLSALLVLVATVSASAQTTHDPSQTAPDPPQACPKPPQMTYDEVGECLTSDWRNDFPEAIRNISLGHDENYYASIAFRIRECGEYFGSQELFQQTIGKRLPDAALTSARGFHLGERIRFFGALVSSLIDGGPRAGLVEEKMYVDRSFFDLGLWKSVDGSLTLRVGRREPSLEPFSSFSFSLSACLGVSALDEVESSV